MQTFATLSIVIYFFLLGSFYILSNLHASNLPEEVEKGGLPFYREYGTRWRKRLLLWRVIEHEDEAPTVLKDVITSWELIQWPQRIATGITMVLYALAYVFWMILSKGAFLNNVSLLFKLWIVFIVGSLLGDSFGYVVGFWYARREVRRRVTYADLRQRRLSDYRSQLLRWLPGCAMLLEIVLLLILPSLLGVQPSLLSNAWQGTAVIGGIYIVGESFLSYIATLPRLVVTSNPTVAQHADDLLRALVINDIHVRMLIGIGGLLIAQWFLLYQWLLVSYVCMALQFLITLLWLGGLLPVMWRTRDKGRLGGRLTGWAWSKLVTP